MKKTMWSYPWGYAESFAIATGILLTGMVMEMFLPPAGAFIPSWPGNLYLLIGILLFTAVLILFRKKSKIIQWLGSVFAAVGFSSAFTLLVIVMGAIPQQPSMAFYHRIGLTQVNASWPFYLIGLLMVFSLLLASAKKAKTIRFRNVVFQLNHLGLVVILLGGGLGKSDFRDLTMTLMQGEPVWYAKNSQGGRENLDFALEMNNFNISYHLPVLQIRNSEYEIIKSVELDTTNVIQQIDFKDYKIIVENVFPEAVMSKDGFDRAHHPAAVTAAKIKINEPANADSGALWISSGSRITKPHNYEIGSFTINLSNRMPKIYETTAQLYSKQGINKEVKIKVNEPISINGWKIYQSSYNEAMGRWSQISILSLVKDPWLWVVYTGIFMLIGGALGLFVIGKSYKIK